ncbi:hypothetical protein [Streptomyces sp. CS081A]|uniref:hypothetical protein n=1 Tax=Streptomyces sp. CS081A TaxID=2162709 RepID=UPI00195077E5|nr:hypothetical protein [Streptomyces sp. CS081A]
MTSSETSAVLSTSVRRVLISTASTEPPGLTQTCPAGTPRKVSNSKKYSWKRLTGPTGESPPAACAANRPASAARASSPRLRAPSPRKLSGASRAYAESGFAAAVDIEDWAPSQPTSGWYTPRSSLAYGRVPAKSCTG